jgi:2-C-methyl-D-erythritol 2,4-cyclodiphosphate synthase
MVSNINEYRVGHGLDVHPFQQGRPCVLGGVEIPHTCGLAGHSDADVLVHALMDALLGAAGESDIGVLFPDTDPAFKGADSCVLLAQVWGRLKASGWKVVNADITLLAEAPRVSPYVSAMRRNLSNIVEVPASNVTIKATTTERMGFVGRGEGIVASAVVLLSRERETP